jgi:hypothetical protein
MPSLWPKLSALVLAALLLAGRQTMAAEEPRYDVLASTDVYEIRRYSPYIVAETDVDGTFRTAGGKAFDILAAYIFGDNRASEKMAMTVPVQSRPAAEGVSMAMTTPVTSVGDDRKTGRYTYSFVMESKYTLDTLPVPNDPRVRIRELPARTIAVRRYSGSWSLGNYRRQEKALLDALARDGVATMGTTFSARYNAPFIPSFMRRNEVMILADSAERGGGSDAESSGTVGWNRRG